MMSAVRAAGGTAQGVARDARVPRGPSAATALRSRRTGEGARSERPPEPGQDPQRAQTPLRPGRDPLRALGPDDRVNSA